MVLRQMGSDRQPDGAEASRDEIDATPAERRGVNGSLWQLDLTEVEQPLMPSPIGYGGRTPGT